MGQIICNACNAPFDDSNAACPVCGLANLKQIGESEEAKAMLQKIAKDYTQKKLGDSDISILAYEYEEKNGQLVEKKVHTIPVAKAADLVYGETAWFSEKFARIEADRTMDLGVVVRKADGSSNKTALHFKTPKLEDFWYLGVKLVEGFAVVFRIGNKDIYTETEKVSLL